MALHIFVSHSSLDKQIAERICDNVEYLGFRCWVAFRDLLGGDNYLNVIPTVLRSSDLMIVILSANANRSMEIPKELSLASQFGIPVLPIRVENFEFNNALKYEFSTRQYIDLFPLWERGMEQLATRLQGLKKSAIDCRQFGLLALFQIIENGINRQLLHRLPFDAAARLIEDIAVARENATDPAPHAASLLVLRARYFVRNGIGWRGPEPEELLRQTRQLDIKTAIRLANVLRITHEEFVTTIRNA